jgi:hypothetical protein
MQMLAMENVSPYEAFMKYGLGDGDSPFAHAVMDAVISRLDQLGYDVQQIGGLHNHAICALVTRDGAAIDLQEAAERAGVDLEEGPEAVRRALLAAGLHDVVQALDEMERSGPGDLPAVVVLRHPNQGDAVDVRLFATPAEAAAFALQHDDEDMDVLVPLPPEERTATRRYRQVVDSEELEALAGGTPGQ